MSISSLLLAAKEGPAAQTAKGIIAWLESRGASGRVLSTISPPEALRTGAQGVDAVLVLGGDGAMLGVARALIGTGVPLLGVNFGRVGFLTEVPAEDWQPSLEALLAGEYQVQPHTALRWRVLRGEKEISSGWAINDVVAARGEVARAVALDLRIHGFTLSRLRCDGVIVSAPLGATAYAASAHGPLAFPSLHAQIVTPISPFAGAFPPLVLPEDCPVGLDVMEGDARLTVDGQICLPLPPGDSVEVRGEPGRMPLLVRDPHWYVKRLAERGFVQPGPGTYSAG